MEKYKLKDNAGKFYVTGKGFVAADQKSGSEVCDEVIISLENLGYSFEEVAVTESSDEGVSYGVVYIRKKDVKGAVLSKQAPNTQLGELDPSKRRFKTWAEARAHGIRFSSRRANKADKPGTANHQGFFIVETQDAVNSKVNWKTLMTNSIKE